ncbi:MAG: maltotransferase domain-containing protein, partial [Acidimicrobiia bacterium]
MAHRIIIENLHPSTPNGFPAKATAGRPLLVTADVFRDGHDVIAARVRWRSVGDGRKWQVVPMVAAGNDRFEATLVPTALGLAEFVVEGWTDRLATWRHGVTVKLEAGQDVAVELEEGALLLDAAAARVDRADRDRVAAAARAVRDEVLPTDDRLAPATDPSLVAALSEVPDPADLARSKPAPVRVERERAAAGAWYELFPRSYGGLTGAAERLPGVAAMGFDVVYIPPVHPIGTSFRKGKNNSLGAEKDDPGSPWAIGGPDGGHTALHPDLGTFDDFDAFVDRARSLGMEVALDYALQCSPEHPWLAERPEWFHHRPDGTIKYAENPPKKYQDIYPINMWPPDDGDRTALWEACREVL